MALKLEVMILRSMAQIEAKKRKRHQVPHCELKSVSTGMLPCLTSLQLLVSGRLARSGLQQESLNVLVGFCWEIDAFYRSPVITALFSTVCVLEAENWGTWEVIVGTGLLVLGKGRSLLARSMIWRSWDDINTCLPGSSLHCPLNH